MVVPIHNEAIDSILDNSKINHCKVDGLIYKDSLDITNKDRISLKNYLLKCSYKKVIIVHGTDTMDKTAHYLSKHIKHKKIILTGAMIPFSLGTIEASSNLMLAIGYIQSKIKQNIYISMHGHVKKYNKIRKNRSLGVFECQK